MSVEGPRGFHRALVSILISNVLELILLSKNVLKSSVARLNADELGTPKLSSPSCLTKYDLRMGVHA